MFTKYTNVLTVNKNQSRNINPQQCKENYAGRLTACSSFYKHINNYKQDLTLTVEFGELCVRAGVLTHDFLNIKTNNQKP